MNAVLKPCTCYSRVENDGLIYPVLCKEHFIEKHKVLGNRTFKYTRWFDTEQDAKDRTKIINDRWGEGYGAVTQIHPVSRWFLVTASWSDSCD